MVSFNLRKENPELEEIYSLACLYMYLYMEALKELKKN